MSLWKQEQFHKKTMINNSLQECKTSQKTLMDSLITPIIQKVFKGGSCLAPLSGSLTVEAALVIPLFLFAMINILSLFLMFEKYAVQLAQLHQTGRQLAVLAHSQEENMQTQDIELVKAEYVRPLINIMGYQGCLIVNGCVMHKWTGYDLEGEKAEETAADKMVFVTAYGSVYHTGRNCSYLNPAVTMLERSAAAEALNRDGVRYQACRLCRGENQLVYITEDGDCFHASITCSGLKRTVSCVLQSEAIAEGKNACSRCRSG